MKKYLILLIFLILNSTFLIQNSFSQWVQQSVPVTGGIFWDMKFSNASTGFIAHSPNVLLKTTNAGYNWLVNKNWRITSISIVDSQCIYAVGYNDSKSYLYKTSNQGISWDSIYSPIDYYTYLYFYNRDTGVISGGDTFNNFIWYTTNGGQTKQLVATHGGATTGKFFFLKEKVNGEYYGYLYYPQGRYLYCTSNSGANWQYRQFLPIAVNSIYFINKDTGWATASTSTNYVMKTIDGGLNWVNQFIPYNETCYELYFANPRRGWACTPYNKIFATSNGGITWGTQNLPITFSGSLCFLDSLIGWTGNGTEVAHTTNGGGTITSTITINKEILMDFKLYQNYPNPFNPSTIIKYKLNKPGIISLKIFSLTGNEIIKIENNIKQAGYYEYSFTPKNLSSGVYIYKVEVFNLYNNLIYSDSKRMIYIK